MTSEKYASEMLYLLSCLQPGIEAARAHNASAASNLCDFVRYVADRITTLDIECDLLSDSEFSAINYLRLYTDNQIRNL